MPATKSTPTDRPSPTTLTAKQVDRMIRSAIEKLQASGGLEQAAMNAFLKIDDDAIQALVDKMARDDDSDFEDRIDALEDENRRKSGPPPIAQAVQSLLEQSPAISTMLVTSYVRTVEMLEGVKLTNLERRLNMAKSFGVTLEPKHVTQLLFPELDLTERANGGVVHASSRTTIRTEVDDDGTVVSRRETSTDHFVPPEMPPMPEEGTPTRSSVKHS